METLRLIAEYLCRSFSLWRIRRLLKHATDCIDRASAYTQAAGSYNEQARELEAKYKAKWYVDGKMRR